jgi:hypothetical protein
MRPTKPPPKRDTASMVPVPDFVRVNQARKREGMDPLPTDEMLDSTLEKAGFTHCLDKPYRWTGLGGVA